MRSRLAEGGALAMRLSLVYWSCASRRSLFVIKAKIEAGLPLSNASDAVDSDLRKRRRRRSGTFDFLERLPRIAKRVNAGRDAAINRDLKQDLLDLFLGEPVLQCALHMQLELVRPVERPEHCQIDDAARAAVESGP